MNIVLSANMSPRVRMCACSNTGTHLDPVRIYVSVGSERDVAKDTGDADPKDNVNGNEAKETSGTGEQDPSGDISDKDG